MTLAANEHSDILLDRPRRRGMVVSCYADMTADEARSPRWRTHLENEARTIRLGLAGDPEALGEFEARYEAIRCALESPDARHGKGMAVFAGPEGHPLSLSADEPYANYLVVDERPYLIPLLVAEHRRREYLVVETDSHRGRIHAAGPGRSRLLGEFDAEIPRKQRSSGERWGWKQSAIDRHPKGLINHHWDDLARAVEKAWDAHRFRGIVLLGEHEVLENFRARLPKRLAGRVVREVPHSWRDDPTGIGEVLAPIVAEAIRDEEERLLTDAVGRQREGLALAAAPQEVLTALADGQVADILLGPDPGELASHCTGCGSTFAFARDTCPYCAARCERTRLWQEIASMAARHDVPVHFLDADPRLAELGGVAALLARDEPQWAKGDAALENGG